MKYHAESMYAIKRLLPLCLCLVCLSSANGQTAKLFQSDDILEFTLKCDMKALQKDRDQESEYHMATLQYQEGQTMVDIPLRIKTRGGFRKIRSNCQYPPLFLNFAKATTPEESIFGDQDKTKLVTPCSGDEYVVQEYLVYKMYNLLSPKSLNARLVKVIFYDNVKDKSSDPHFGILLEEEEQMAERNETIIVDTKLIRPQYTVKEDFLKMAVFQYMIGNTDWSVQYKQNIKLIAEDTLKIPSTVAYDFDHAGIVRAPYANPAPELKMSSTLQRRYRGHCIEDMSEFDEVFVIFNELKEDFYALYTENPLLSEKYKKRTIKFLDDFYETINDPNKAKDEFTYPCNKSGTGNVIIKGLKEN